MYCSDDLFGDIMRLGIMLSWFAPVTCAKAA